MIRETRIPRAATIPRVEEFERLFRGSRQTPSNNQQTDRNGIHTQERAILPTGGEPELEASFHTVTNQIVSIKYRQTSRPPLSRS